MSTRAVPAVLAAVMGVVLVCAGNSMAAWGSKELETEKIAVNLAREAERGGYKVVNTEELKKWIDDKKTMLIVDTMPYADSYKKEPHTRCGADRVSHPGNDHAG